MTYLIGGSQYFFFINYQYISKISFDTQTEWKKFEQYKF